MLGQYRSLENASNLSVDAIDGMENYLPLAGGTMVGDLKIYNLTTDAYPIGVSEIDNDPTFSQASPRSIATASSTKTYINNQIAAAPYLPLSGGVMTGDLQIFNLTTPTYPIGVSEIDNDPTFSQASPRSIATASSTKTYINNQIATAVAPYLPLAGGVMTGDLQILNLTSALNPVGVNEIDNDTTFAQASPRSLPTTHAVKTYVDNAYSAGTNINISAIPRTVSVADPMSLNEITVSEINATTVDAAGVFFTTLQSKIPGSAIIHQIFDTLTDDFDYVPTSHAVKTYVDAYVDTSIASLAFECDEPVGVMKESACENAVAMLANGYLLCDGSTLTKAQYGDLWTAFGGHLYGTPADPTNTFLLPTIKNHSLDEPYNYIECIKTVEQDIDAVDEIIAFENIESSSGTSITHPNNNDFVLAPYGTYKLRAEIAYIYFQDWDGYIDARFYNTTSSAYIGEGTRHKAVSSNTHTASSSGNTNAFITTGANSATIQLRSPANDSTGSNIIKIFTNLKSSVRIERVLALPTSDTYIRALSTPTITNRFTIGAGLTLSGLTLSTTLADYTPIGAMVIYTSLSIPSGWIHCNGQSLNTTTYATLFAVIGYTYGGAGSSFNIPDMRGLFVRGLDTLGLVDPDFRQLGDIQTSANLSHDHTGTTGNQSAHHRHVYNDKQFGGFAGSGYGLQSGSANYQNRICIDDGSVAQNTDYSTTNHTHTFTTATSGGDESRPINIALPYIIRYI